MGDAMHTPAPWIANGASVNTKPDESAVCVCVSMGTRDRAEAEANARLIAAAPELLAALKWMVDNDETNEGDTPLEGHGGKTWNEINAYWIDGLNNARAAIAKAEGRE